MVTKNTGRTTPKGTVAPRPVIRAEAPTTVASWKMATAGSLLSLPSGNTCLVRTPGLGAFIKQGKIPNSLLGIIQEAMASKGASTEDVDVDSFLQDPEKLAGIMQLCDEITVDCVVDPRVYPAPIDPSTGEVLPLGAEGRRDDRLYVDEIDFNDKMAVFNYVAGGTAELEKFREESPADVESVPER